MQNKLKCQQIIRIVVLLVTFIVTLFINGCVFDVASNSVPRAEKIAIYTLDIGQGDAHLLRIRGDDYLIDAGDIEHREYIAATLHQMGVKRLKAIICTHPDSDHIGGIWKILQEFEVETIYDNGYDKPSTAYKTYVRTIEKKKITRRTLHAGDNVDLGYGAKFIVYAPWDTPLLDKDGHPDTNDNSIIGKLVYGKFSMLFTGDAGTLEEDKVIREQNSKLFSRVLKVAHHGSKNSSQRKFIRSIKPEYAIISSGLDNAFGHPTDEVLSRLEKENVIVYRTDKQGTIRIETDGKTWEVFTER